MEFFEVIQRRHCCRSFDSDKPVADNDLEKIIAAGKMAPSAGGIYPVEFLVIRNKNIIKQIAEASHHQLFITKAPVVLVIVADIKKTTSHYGQRGRELYVIQDSAAAAENIFLTTIALGLSTCWIGAFDEVKIAKIVNLAPSFRPMVIMPIGWSA